MAIIPWILIFIVVLIIIFIFIFYYHSMYCKRRPTDYYNLFIIGLIWFIIGLPLKSSALYLLGLAFMIAGLVNKKKWKKNKITWKMLTKKEKYIHIIIITLLTVLLIAGIAVFFLM